MRVLIVDDSRPIRSIPEMGPMKTMMVTTVADHALIEEALSAGADEYLMKSFDATALMGKLQMIGVECSESKVSDQ